MMKLKQGITILKQDIMDWYKGILVAIVYIILTNIIFGSVCTTVIAIGVPCPACGLTRAGISFMTLHWEEAWKYNFVILLIVPYIIYLLVCRYVLQCECRLFVPGLVLICICLVILYVYRMLNDFPDTPPMVYNDTNMYQYIKAFINNLFLGG